MFKVIIITICFLLLTVSNIGARSQYYKAEFCDVGFDVPQVLDTVDKHKSILNEFDIKISVYTFVSKNYKICARLSRNNNIYAYLVCDHNPSSWRSEAETLDFSRATSVFFLTFAHNVVII